MLTGVRSSAARRSRASPLLRIRPADGCLSDLPARSERRQATNTRVPARRRASALRRRPGPRGAIDRIAAHAGASPQACRPGSPPRGLRSRSSRARRGAGGRHRNAARYPAASGQTRRSVRASAGARVSRALPDQQGADHDEQRERVEQVHEHMPGVGEDESQVERLRQQPQPENGEHHHHDQHDDLRPRRGARAAVDDDARS